MEAHMRASGLAPRAHELARAIENLAAPPPFAEALRRTNVTVIAEVKRSSPSKGAINTGMDIEKQLRAYEAGGAAAISILTEPTRFGGSNEDLKLARQTVKLPLLKKDFHVDVVQILEARALGASAALVIARAVDPARLEALMQAGQNSGIEILVEVRDERELDLALTLGATLIGVNNRNLETLQIDPETSSRLLPLVPQSVVAIAESGVQSAADIRRVASAGADAVLVGSELSRSADPENSLRALIDVPRMVDARKG